MAERQPMHIRSLRMQESKGMTSESSPPPHLFALRPSDLEGNTLTPSSPAENLSRPQTLSGITTPAHMLREAGSPQTFATSGLSSTGSTPAPPHSRELVLASSSTAPATVSTLGKDRAPLAASQHLLGDLVNLLRRLSISERSSVLQSSPASPEPPSSLPTTSIRPEDLHASRDASLGGPMSLELPAANGASSSVGSRLGSHSESDAPAQRRERGRGSRQCATRQRGNPYPQHSGEGGSAASSSEAQSLISSRRSKASSTEISRATSRIPEQHLLTVPEVAIVASNSPPPSHSLLP